jgi:hypothetical protein
VTLSLAGHHGCYCPKRLAVEDNIHIHHYDNVFLLIGWCTLSWGTHAKQVHRQNLKHSFAHIIHAADENHNGILLFNKSLHKESDLCSKLVKDV